MTSWAASNTPFALSCAADVAIGLAALAWVASGPRPGRRVLPASCVLIVVLAAKGVALLALGVAIPFGVAHVLWLDLVIVLPSWCLAVLATPRLRRVRALAIGASAGLLLVPLGVWASFVEPSRLVVERHRVPLAKDRDGSTPVRIAVIADLQFERVGDRERRAVDLAVAQHPDVILIAGDVHSGTSASFAEQEETIHALLRRLRAPAGVYAVQGDAESLVKARRVYARTGIRLLVNRTARLRIGDRDVLLTGLELRYRSREARAAARRLTTANRVGAMRILLTHRPDAVLGLPTRSKIDLTVAGHTHGGQIQLPGIGPLSVASSVPRSVGAGGLHTIRGNHIYVSRGIGVERNQAPRVRFGATPEVSLLTLR